MTAKYYFTVPGKPIGKERPRRGKNGVWYTPTATKKYESRVAIYARLARVRPIAGSVWCILDVYLPDRRRRDVDNICKSVLDALNGVAWQDDTQVARLTVTKKIDSVDPRVEVCIGEVPA